MEAPLVIMVALLMVPLFIWLKNQSDKIKAQIDAAWQNAAAAVDGTYTPPSTRWYDSSSRTIHAEINGIEVKVDHYSVRTGKNQTTTYTRAVASAKAPEDFRLKVYGSSFLSDLGRAVGFQDVLVGDRAFDEAYVVKSNDPEAAVLWLNQTVRRSIAGAEAFTFEVHRGAVRAKRPMLLRDEDALVALVQAVAALADGRQRVVKAWKKLGAKYQGTVKKRPGRWASLDVELDGVPMVLDTRKMGDLHLTFVTGQVVGARLAPFVLANDPHVYSSRLPRETELPTPRGYALWTEDPRGVEPQLTPAVLALIDDLEPAKVRVDEEEVTVTWEGIATRQEEMERAMQLCAALANGPSRGPYR